MIVLSIGGYSLDSFSKEIHLKEPKIVLGPLIDELPEVNEIVDIDIPGSTDSNNENTENPESNTELADGSETSNNPDIFTDPGLEDPGTIDFGNNDTSNPYIDENGNFIKHDIVLSSESESKISHVKSVKVKLDDAEMELTSDNTIDFIKWLHNNYNAASKIEIEVEKDPIAEASPENVVYNDILESEVDLYSLVSTIKVVDSLPEGDDYDRTIFEKPVKSYTLNGEKVNRNDYAWKTSKWFDEESYTYMCPYTGTIIHDLDDNKDDLDFGNLDYDHIVPLKSAYIRGAADWTQEQANEYSYNQWIGVDVLNSANRSKSDKGPCEYMPDINQEDYCYSWLMICSYYNLAMTQEEIDLCTETIALAMANGETVEFLGGEMIINE